MRRSAEVVYGQVMAPRPGWSLLRKIGVALAVLLAGLVWILSSRLSKLPF